MRKVLGFTLFWTENSEMFLFISVYLDTLLICKAYMVFFETRDPGARAPRPHGYANEYVV